MGLAFPFLPFRVSSAALRASPRMIPDCVSMAPGQSTSAALLRVCRSVGVILTDTDTVLFSLTPKFSLKRYKSARVTIAFLAVCGIVSVPRGATVHPNIITCATRGPNHMRPLTGPQHRLPRGGDRCDFCGMSTVSSLYTCTNFLWHEQRIFAGDSGRWAACAVCSGLINRAGWEALVERVMREVRKRRSPSRSELGILRADLQALYHLLREHLDAGRTLQVSHPRIVKITRLSTPMVMT